MSDSEDDYEDTPKLEETSDGEKGICDGRAVTKQALNVQIKTDDWSNKRRTYFTRGAITTTMNVA